MEIEDIKAISYLQIFVLVFSIFAFSYLVAENSKPFNFENFRVESKNKSNLFLSKVLGFVKLFTEESIPLASAQEEQLGCCLESKDDKFCVTTNESNCESGFSLGICEDKDECQIGCCYDSAGTSFSKNSYKGFCGGIWDPSSICNIPQAKLGCCYLSANDVRPGITQGECKQLTSDLTKSNTHRWEDIPEYQFSILATLASKGACVIDYGSDNSACFFTDIETCTDEYSGSFFKGKLCTDSELKTSCEPTENTKCVNGKVYFLDSCNNVVNIYDSSKVDDDDYWTNYYSIYESCNTQDENCGNCDGLETSCIGGTQNATCEDVGCSFKHPITNVTKEYNHLDQWCVYESQIGEGHDVPGSEHYIATCNYGEITYQSVNIGRKSICTTMIAENSDGSYIFEKTQAVANGALGCLWINSEYTDNNDRIEACEEQPYCKVGMVFFNSSEKNNENVEHLDNLTKIENRLVKSQHDDDLKEIVYCFPEYPSSSDVGCSMATMSFQADLKYGWVDCNDCEVNLTHVLHEDVWKEYVKVRKKEDFFLRSSDKYLVYDETKSKVCKDGDCYAFDQSFVEAMNSYCMSLGDCGVSANVAGDIDASRLSVTINPNNLSESYIEMLKSFAIPEGDEKIIYNATALLRELTNGTDIFSVDSDLASTEFLDSIYGFGNLIVNSFGIITGPEAVVSLLFSEKVAASIMSVLGPVAAIAAVTYAAVGISYWLSNEYGVTPGVTNDIAITTAVVTAVTATTLYFLASNSVWIFTTLAVNPLGWAIAIALVIGVATAWVYASTSARTVQTISFSCNSWKPIAGSEKCEECGADGLPCSEYKCKSYGTGCGIVKTPEGDKCVALEQPPYMIPEIEGLEIYKIDDYIEENGAENLIYLEGNLMTYNPQGFFESNSLENQYKFSITDNPSPSPADRGFNVQELVNPYDSIFIRFNTTTYSECKLDMDEGNVRYEDFKIPMLQEGTEYTSKSHYYILKYPDPTGGAGSETEDPIPMPLFIRCLSNNALESPRYLIRFDINPGDDLTPPYIISRNPRDNSYVSFDTLEREVSIILNEPVELCRWSEEDKEFTSMEHAFDCTDENCKTNFSMISAEEKKTFYIKCKDKYNNVNIESMKYTLNKPKDKIQIDSISPNDREIVKIGKPKIELPLVVSTSGGTDDHYCYYNYLDYNRDSLSKTGKKGEHKVTFTAFNPGVHTVNITCEDWNTGDKVEKQTTFEIIHDTKAPIVLQNYIKGNTFYLKTDEPSACYYSTNNSFFNLEDGTKMEVGLTLTKAINNPIYNTLYYVQCEDEFGNYQYVGKYKII